MSDPEGYERRAQQARRDHNLMLDKDDDDWAWRRKLRANPHTARLYRFGVGAVGLVIVVAGLIMVPFPGPGWLVVFLGLAVWASEFEWAQGLLHFAKRNVKAFNAWIRQQPLWVQCVSALLTFLVVLGIFWVLFKVAGVPAFFPDGLESWMKDSLGLG